MTTFVSIRSLLIRALASRLGTTRAIYAAAFLVATGIGQIIGIGLAFFARDLHGATPSMVGMLNAVWSTCYVVGLIGLRAPLSKLRPSTQILIGMACATTGTLLIQHAPGIVALAVLTGLTGMSLSMFWPPLVGWLTTGFEGARLGKILGSFNLSWSTGIIIGPYLCGWLTQIGPRVPLYVATAAFAATFVTVGTAVLTTRDAPAATPPPGQSDADSGVGSTPLRFPAWTGLVAAFFAMGTIITVFPLSAQGDLGLSASLIGAALAVRALMNTVTFVLMARVSFWHFRVWPMVLSLLLTAGGMVGLAVARSLPLLLLCMGGLGMMGSVSYNASIFHGASGARDRSVRMAIHEGLLSIGLLTGAAVSGWLYDMAGMTVAYSTAAAVLIAAVPVALVVAAISRRQQESLN